MRLRSLFAALTLAVAGTGCFTPESQITVEGNGGGGGSTTHHNVASTRSNSGGGSGTSSSDSGSGTSSNSSGSSSVSSSSSTSAPGSSSSSSASTSESSSSGSSSSGPMACGASGGGSGSNQLFNCSNLTNFNGDGGGCPEDWLGTQVIDFESCSPICGATVEAVDSTGVTVAGTQQLSQPPGGLFRFCLPANTTFETTVTAPTYSNFVYGEIQGQVAVDLPMLGLLSNEELSAFAVFISGGLNPADGALVAFIVNLDDCGGADAAAGWTITLTDESGNAYPSGGYETLYIDSTGFPNPTLTSTSAYGVAILYNINPSIAQYPTLHATSSGSGCQLVNQLVGFTGRIEVGPNLFSEQGLFVE